MLLLAKVKGLFQVTYDSLDGEGFVVSNYNGAKRHFKESHKGLLYPMFVIKVKLHW